MFIYKYGTWLHKKQENTTQIKAVGALVCHNKLRKSQTLAFAAKFTRYCFASQLESNGMVTYVKVSGATQATK